MTAIVLFSLVPPPFVSLFEHPASGSTVPAATVAARSVNRIFLIFFIWISSFYALIWAGYAFVTTQSDIFPYGLRGSTAVIFSIRFFICFYTALLLCFNDVHQYSDNDYNTSKDIGNVSRIEV